MAPDDLAIGLPDLLLPRHVCRLVGNEPGQSREMEGLTPRFRQHLYNVCEGALDLPHEIIAHEFASLVPPNLTGDENLASLGGDAVGIALGRQPIFGLKKFERVLAHG